MPRQVGHPARMPQVYSTPAGNLWLVLKEEGDRAVWCLNLETGEARRMTRPLKELRMYGWRPL